ncbi:MAG TPA: hypothetical protein VG435_11035 [Acidimicrobiales bacterium]|jgi:hypothetical protein|nr:hypothetical protein [Acidimicrobiales bacterium]
MTVLTFAEARESPCLTCSSSPCCTHLLLGTLDLDTLIRVDHALYLLNFDGIYLTMNGARDEAQVYLHQPCGFLDQRGLCSVHSTPVQPAVCKAYKSQTCSYRRISPDTHGGVPLLDHARMTAFVERLVFDDERQVIERPEWPELIAAFSELPFERQPLRSGAGDWQPVAAPAGPGARFRFSDPQVSSPCTGCQAWCCQVLTFDRGRPSDASQLDFMKYSLGFPGVELAISDDTWRILVHTSCRHLENGRCSVYGKPERPLECEAYDEFECDYRRTGGLPHDAPSVRLRLDQFSDVAGSIVFDELGQILAIPPVAVLRRQLGDHPGAVPHAH